MCQEVSEKELMESAFEFINEENAVLDLDQQEREHYQMWLTEARSLLDADDLPEIPEDIM